MEKPYTAFRLPSKEYLWTTLYLEGIFCRMSEPWTPVCEKNNKCQRFIANPGFNAKLSTMVLPRRQFLAASVFCASATEAIPRRHIPPRVVRVNVTSGYCPYLRPPQKMASTTPPNIIFVVAVTTMTAAELIIHHQN